MPLRRLINFFTFQGACIRFLYDFHLFNRDIYFILQDCFNYSKKFSTLAENN